MFTSNKFLNKNLKCYICGHIINNIYYKTHFEQCKQYIITKNNKFINNTYSKEHIFIKLSDFLDNELKLNNEKLEKIKEAQFQERLKFKKQEIERLQKINEYNELLKKKQLREQNEYNTNIQEKTQLKEQQLKEQQLREQQLREQQLKEQHLREQQLKEQQLREQQLREQQLREQQLREQQLREQNEYNMNAHERTQLREQQLREQQLKEQKLREQQLKEQQLREQQLREQQLREQQLREKEQEPKEYNRKPLIEKEKEYNKKQLEKKLKKSSEEEYNRKQFEKKLRNQPEEYNRIQLIEQKSYLKEKKQKEFNEEKEDFKKLDIINSNIPNILRNYSIMNINNNALGNNTIYIKKILLKYNELFAQYVNNKNVAIIGPANSIIGTKKGDVIDKFDIIIRLNKALPIPSKLKDDIGSRTDIIYNALNTSDYPGQNNLDTTFYKENGVKFVVSPYPLYDIFYNDIINYINRYQFDIPFRTVNKEKHISFVNQIKTRPYTGTSAIMDILSFNIKSLYITGIDFYNTPYYSQYRKIKKNKLLNLRENAIHIAYPQMEYLLYKSLVDDRIILDNTLEKLLFNQYIKIVNNINEINMNLILKTTNQRFIDFLNCKNLKILVIGKNIENQKIDINKYDLIFNFNKNNYNIDNNKLILINNNQLNVIANININKNYGNNENIILLNTYTKSYMKSLFTLVDIKSCSPDLYFIMYIILLFKKIEIIGFNFDKQLNKSDKYKEFLLICFLNKFKYINFLEKSFDKK
jgi:uncharacterized protein YjbI with pentapeptide repeats